MDFSMRLADLLQTYGPYGTATIAIIAAWWKNREAGKLSEKVIEMAKAQTEAVVNVTSVMSGVKEMVGQYNVRAENNKNCLIKIEQFMDDARRKLEKLEERSR